METQTIINIVFAMAFVGYVVWQRNPTFNKITCKGWKVVDERGRQRITAFTSAKNECWANAAVQWLDTEGIVRIEAGTYPSGLDKKSRLSFYETGAYEGDAVVQWCSYENGRNTARNLAQLSGTVFLSTKDISPPKEP